MLYFHPALVVRTPAHRFDQQPDEGGLLTQTGEPAFAEALYLASPSLHDERRKLALGQEPDAKKKARVQSSLARYYARMSSRCTPFGLFAGCGVMAWGAATHIRHSPAAHRRHTRLDMHYLCALASELAERPAVQQRLRYFPNSSLYAIGEELRYTEFRFENDELIHQISAVAASEPVQQVLACGRSGATRAELAHALLQDGLTLADTLAFVSELIQEQVLVSELEPTVTGPEFLAHILGVLTRLQTPPPSPEIRVVQDILLAAQAALAALDEPGAANDPAAYAQIIQLLQGLEVPIDASKLFQTDLIYHLPGATLAQHDVQPQLLAAVEALRRLAPPPAQGRLEQFVPRFQARYEDREVPLLEALDEESGLSYAAQDPGGYAALVHDLVAAPAAPARSITQNKVQQLLYQKLRAADRQGDYTVTITPEELAQLEPPSRPLPASVSVMFRLGGGGQVVLESVGGSSAANLLGRFAHADPAIEHLVRDITALEQQHNPGVQFAEVCHLPISRLGNILLRPHFRALEIPYLAQSTLPTGQQLALQDLLVSVRHGQLRLRSRRLNQLIVPRLSSAHNFTNQALPVYQFLCDLQTQGVQPQLAFSWQPFAFAAKFMPRLSCGPVVLHPAAWELDAADFKPLFSDSDAEVEAPFRAFCAQWRLPQRFTLADGDNELLVDSDNPLSVRAWLDAIRARPSIRLREFLFDPAQSPVTDAAGRPYVSQFVASLIQTTPSYPAAAAPPGQHEAAVPRDFILGSEWLYLKLYCGPKVVSRLLVDVVKPLTELLAADGLLSEWFFIRYADPDTHLRLRLHLPAPARIGEVIGLLNDFLAPHLASGYVWKMQTDTYRRELERYGPGTIGLAETIFCLDSHYAVALLAHSATHPDPDTTIWRWSLRLIDSLLDAFEYDLTQKIALLHQLREAFAQEFGGGKELRLQVDAKYRQHRAAIARALRPHEHEPAAAEPSENDGEPVALLAYHRRRPFRQAAQALLLLARQGQLEVPLPQLLSSYIHMLLNRLMATQARLHELVLYDFLARHYLSEQAREKPVISSPRS